MSSYHILNAIWIGVFPMLAVTLIIGVICYILCCLNQIKIKCKEHRKRKATTSIISNGSAGGTIKDQPSNVGIIKLHKQNSSKSSKSSKDKKNSKNHHKQQHQQHQQTSVSSSGGGNGVGGSKSSYAYEKSLSTDRNEISKENHIQFDVKKPQNLESSNSGGGGAGGGAFYPTPSSMSNSQGQLDQSSTGFVINPNKSYNLTSISTLPSTLSHTTSPSKQPVVESTSGYFEPNIIDRSFDHKPNEQILISPIRHQQLIDKSKVWTSNAQPYYLPSRSSLSLNLNNTNNDKLNEQIQQHHNQSQQQQQPVKSGTAQKQTDIDSSLTLRYKSAVYLPGNNSKAQSYKSLTSNTNRSNNNNQNNSVGSLIDTKLIDSNNEQLEQLIVQELNESPKSIYSRLQTLARIGQLNKQQQQGQQNNKNHQQIINQDSVIIDIEQSPNTTRHNYMNSKSKQSPDNTNKTSKDALIDFSSTHPTETSNNIQKTNSTSNDSNKNIIAGNEDENDDDENNEEEDDDDDDDDIENEEEDDVDDEDGNISTSYSYGITTSTTSSTSNSKNSTLNNQSNTSTSLNSFSHTEIDMIDKIDDDDTNNNNINKNNNTKSTEKKTGGTTTASNLIEKATKHFKLKSKRKKLKQTGSSSNQNQSSTPTNNNNNNNNETSNNKNNNKLTTTNTGNNETDKKQKQRKTSGKSFLDDNNNNNKDSSKSSSGLNKSSSLPATSGKKSKFKRLSLTKSKIVSDLEIDDDLIFNDGDDSLSSTGLCASTNIPGLGASSHNTLVNTLSNKNSFNNLYLAKTNRKSSTADDADDNNDDDDDDLGFGDKNNKKKQSTSNVSNEQNKCAPSNLDLAATSSSNQPTSHQPQQQNIDDHLIKAKLNPNLINSSSMSDIDPDENILKNLLIKSTKRRAGNS